MDFNSPGVYGYEQAFQVLQQLKAPHSDFEELFRRMLFNIIARIQDDHTRNIVFLMDDAGVWRLSPFFDVIWSFNPSGEWTNLHQMSINGKRDNFVKSDVLAVADQFNVKKAEEIIRQVEASVVEWAQFAKKAAVAEDQIKHIGQSHRKI
jgi:serine/threonine-protein kinase HipA